MIGISINPFREAVKRLRGKTAVAAKLSSEQWMDVPLALRERAQLSAKINILKVTQSIQDKIDERLAFDEADPERSTMGRGKFMAEMRQLMADNGLATTGPGGVTVPGSSQRLGLIYDFQTQDAMEYGRWKVGQDEAILDEFPAQEFLRIESRIKERKDWSQRWAEAGGKEFDGRMIALKDEPVWTKLSIFGRPWPPFDFGSGMGVRDIDRTEAEELGLIKPNEKVRPSEAKFNDGIQEEVNSLDESKIRMLKSQFGDQISIKDGKVTWRSNA